MLSEARQKKLWKNEIGPKNAQFWGLKAQGQEGFGDLHLAEFLPWGSIIHIACVVPLIIGYVNQSGHTYHMNISLHF